jgi:hypothetical protein
VKAEISRSKQGIEFGDGMGVGILCERRGLTDKNVYTHWHILGA